MNFMNLLETISIEKVVQFGNMSQSSSDVDLLVISDDFESMYPNKRQFFIKQLIQASKPLDAICLTTKEYRKLKERSDPFSNNIKQTGRIIYDNNKSTNFDQNYK